MKFFTALTLFAGLAIAAPEGWGKEEEHYTTSCVTKTSTVTKITSVPSTITSSSTKTVTTTVPVTTSTVKTITTTVPVTTSKVSTYTTTIKTTITSYKPSTTTVKSVYSTCSAKPEEWKGDHWGYDGAWNWEEDKKEWHP